MSSPIRFIALAAAVAGIASASGCASVSDVPPRPDSVGGPRLAFADPVLRDHPELSEQVVVRGTLHGGGTVYVKLLATNLAGGDGAATLTTALTLPDGRKLESRVKKEWDAWSRAPEHLEAHLGDSWLAVVGDRARVHIEDEAFTLDFEVISELAPARPRGAQIHGDGKCYVTTLAIPRGAVRGTVSERGSESLPLASLATVDVSRAERLALFGVGYVEHRAGTIAPQDLAHRVHGITLVSEDETLLFSAVERPDGNGVTRGFLLAARADGTLVYAPDLEVRIAGWSTDEHTGYALPTRVFVTSGDGRFRGIIETGAVTSKKDDLEGLSKLERLIVRRIMKPWTFRFEGARWLFKDSASGKEIRGGGRYQVQQLAQ